MKGMAGNLGGKRLRAMALEAEHEFADGRFERAGERVEDLRREAESLVTALTELLPKAGV